MALFSARVSVILISSTRRSFAAFGGRPVLMGTKCTRKKSAIKQNRGSKARDQGKYKSPARRAVFSLRLPPEPFPAPIFGVSSGHEAHFFKFVATYSAGGSC